MKVCFTKLPFVTAANEFRRPNQVKLDEIEIYLEASVETELQLMGWPRIYTSRSGERIKNSSTVALRYWQFLGQSLVINGVAAFSVSRDSDCLQYSGSLSYLHLRLQFGRGHLRYLYSLLSFQAKLQWLSHRLFLLSLDGTSVGAVAVFVYSVAHNGLPMFCFFEHYHY